MWMFVFWLVGGVSIVVMSIGAEWAVWVPVNAVAVMFIVAGGLGLYQYFDYFDDWRFFREWKRRRQ